MIWECESCGREFVAAHSTACPGCGGIDAVSLPEKASSAGSGEVMDGKEDLPAVKEVLRRLCRKAYDSTFESAEWERLIEETIPQLYAAINEGGRQ
jgi:hypothetical protein